jgi:Fatty acid desaturase
MSPASAVVTVRLPDRPSLVDSTGTWYLEFRRTLKPSYGRLWAELAASVIGIIALMVVSIALVGPLDLLPGILLAIVVGGALGFLEYVLSLFGHAAGHGDLSADRRRNDLLANVLIFPLTGLSVAEYRRVHLTHHRLLGHSRDPEDGYRQRLDARFFLRSLSGFRLIDVDHQRLVRRGGTGRSRTRRPTVVGDRLSVDGWGEAAGEAGSQRWVGRSSPGFSQQLSTPSACRGHP